MNARDHPTAPNPLRTFIESMTRVVDGHGNDEDRLLAESRRLLAGLIRDDTWLPDQFARPDDRGYCQYLLHCDPLTRFCVVSFVWAPGQRTPVHDHTVWGLIGVLRGAERAQRYRHENGRLVAVGDPRPMAEGDIDLVSARVGDIHAVENALSDRVSVSIHVYGGNIGEITRSVFDPQTGDRRMFRSGYTSCFLPNVWGQAAGIHR